MKPVSSVTAPSHEVAVQATPVTRGEIRASIARAYQKVKGQVASEATLDILTAQASLETASGAKMNNFNFAGIKGHGPTGATAKYNTFEVIDGKTIHMVDGFRAYDSLDQGAVDYVDTLGKRFGSALSRAELGDVTGFAHELKRSGYYTASEDSYRDALVGIVGHKLDSSATTAIHTAPPLDSEMLTKVMDLLRGPGMVDQEGALARIVSPD